MLGHRVGRITGYSHHREAKPVGLLQIDVVEAGTSQRDEAGAVSGQYPQDRCVELVVDEGADGGEALGLHHTFEREARLEKGELVAVGFIGPQKVLPVVRLGTEDGNIQSSRLPRLSRHRAPYFT